MTSYIYPKGSVSTGGGLTPEQQEQLANLTLLLGSKADQQYVLDQIAALVGTAPAALDTIYELAAAIASETSALDALNEMVAYRVRFDIANQVLTELQKQNARGNIGAEAVGAAGLVATETTARLDADTALQNAITAEASTRASADTALQAQINYNPITATVAGVRVAAYQSISGEYFLLQNNMSQHTVRGIFSGAGGSTTLASFNLLGTSDFATQGTASVPAKTSTNEWTQLPRTKYLNTTLGYLVFVRYLQPIHFVNQNPALQYDAVNSFLFSASETTLYAGARMFCGSKLGGAVPTDVSPEQMTDFMGVLQSPFFTATPNRLFFAVNGNGVVATVYDTGIDVAVGVGYQLTIFQRKNSRIIGFRLKVINTDVIVERIVDLSTLATSSQPNSGAYYPQVWRSTNGNASGSLVAIDFCRHYNELGN